MPAKAEKLLELVYDAILEPALWNEFTDRLATSVGATSAVLFRMANERNGPAFFGFGETDMDETTVAEYEAHYHKVDDFVHAVLANPVPSVQCVTAHSLVTPEVLRQSEWHNDFIRRHGYDRAGAMIMSESRLGLGQRLTFTALRRHGEEDFDARDFALLKKLAPHIDRAVRIHERIGAAELARQSKLHALDRLSIGVAFFDRHGRVIESNEKAQRIFAENDGLILSRGNIVTAYDQDQGRCDTIIRSATGGSIGSRLRGALHTIVNRPSGARPYQVVVLPGSGPTSRLLLPEATAIAFIFDMSENARDAAGFLSSAYGLTPAEARLALLLYDGMSVKEAAERAEVTDNTARWTLKQIFSKLDIRSQAELVRFLASGPIGLLAIDETATGNREGSP
jgi:DNA-binding CsgD family transcriptional regulator